MFKSLSLKPMYNSAHDNVVDEFYIPVLKRAVAFDRTSAYFSAKALAYYAKGLEYFGRNGNVYRLVISKEISENDYRVLKQGYELRNEVKQEIISGLNEELSISEERNISNLAYLIAKGTVEVKMAFRSTGIFHDKSGIAIDSEGNAICFKGSNNETYAAIMDNYESFNLMCSWLDCDGFYNSGINQAKKDFEALWQNSEENQIVLPMDQVIEQEILKFNKGELLIEDVLLEKNAFVLDYDGQLILHLNGIDLENFVNSGFFKMRLKSKVESIQSDRIVFNTNLVYLDYSKIGERIERKAGDLGYKYYCTNRLKSFIDAKNLHIQERLRVGTNLKTIEGYLIDEYEQFKNVVNQEMSRTLREKQMRDAFYMFAMNKVGNFSVPGSGKTASVLGVFAFLQAKDLVDRIVMIGPKNSFGSWIDEFNICFKDKKELRCFNVHDKSLNTKAKKYELKYNYDNYNLLLINYESVNPYIELLKQIASKRTLLVFDEVHRIKRVDGSRAAASLEVAKDAIYTIAMTGTPLPNSYLDLYNFLQLLFHDEYKEVFGYDLKQLKDPSNALISEINERIQPFFCRTTKRQLGVPEANDDYSIDFMSTAQEQKLFEILTKKYRNNVLALFIRVLQLETNPKLLLETLDLSEFAKILDIDEYEESVDYVDYSDDVYALIDTIDVSTKKKECIDLVSSLVADGKTVVVWCVLVDSINSLKTEFANIGIEAKCIYGAVPLEEREALLNDFKTGKYNVMITNPHTLAESVSLHSVCHDAVYYEYSYNLVHLLQSKDRIHRLGLPDNQYTQYYYLKCYYEYKNKEFSMDDKVYNRLMEKETIMLQAIDNQVLEPVFAPEEDLDIIFKDLFD